MPQVIHVKNLSKRFSTLVAVENLSFSVQQGQVYGFLGQNGAGKSTTIRMLLSLIAPTSGTIQLFGKDLHTHRREVLQKTGAVIEKPDLYPYLTALQNLQLMARLSGMRPSDQQLCKVLGTVGIAERAHSKVKTFSQGMKQRLGLACALVHQPDLVILDEPTNGLDPQGIADVRHLIGRLAKEEGKTILVSSHLLSEIEVIADAMLIIDKGKKVVEGRVADLLDPSHTLLQIETPQPDAAREALLRSAWQGHLLAPGKGLQLRLHKNDIPALNRYLVQQGIAILALQARHSLEDYFLSLTTAQPHVATDTD